MESQSISQDGYLRRWKVSVSSHGASVKSSFAISSTGGASVGEGGDPARWGSGQHGSRAARAVPNRAPCLLYDLGIALWAGSRAVPAR